MPLKRPVVVSLCRNIRKLLINYLYVIIINVVSIRHTPSHSDPARSSYETAFRSGDKIAQLTIELDTMIDSAQEAILTGAADSSIMEELDDKATKILQTASTITASTFTDFHHITSGTHFARERVLMPLLFGTNRPRIRDNRRELSDGMLGKNVDILASIFATYRGLLNTYDNDRARGAIHEETMAALFNYAQDGSMVALPASYYADRYEKTDLDIYFFKNGQGYLTPVSVKSSQTVALAERREYPTRITLCAEDMNNSDFSISRLLIAENEGSPGISAKEKQHLEDTRAALISRFSEQILTLDHTQPVPGQSTQRLLRILDAA